MVNEKLWIKKIQDFCELMNASTKNTGPTASAIYKRIQHNFTDDDMIRAVDDMVDSEISKLTYPIVKRFMTKFKEIRIGAEQQRRKLQERTEVEQMMSHTEIKELIDSIIHKKPGVTPAPDHLKANATIWTKDGKSLDAWIDNDDPNIELGKAVTIVYEQAGDNMVRVQHIRPGMVRHKILTKRPDGPPVRRGPQSMFAPPPEDDFIPELEI